MNALIHPHSASRHSFPTICQRQTGLSLVELMISITVGLLLVAGMSMLFAQQYRARSELEKTSQQIENGRYAMEILRDDIREAGYYGEYYPDPATVTVSYTTPNPCTLDAALGWNWGAVTASVPVAIENNVGTCNLAGRKAGTPILVVRRADTSTISPASAVASVDYEQSTPTQFIVASGVPATFTLTKKDGSTPADLRRYLVHIYYIATPYGVPTLMLLERGSNTPTPLVDGIEDMQFDFGVDNINPRDGSPDVYIAAPAAADWSDVVTVRISLLARNNEATAGYDDNKTYTLGSRVVNPSHDAFRRHVFSEVVRVVNPSGRRE